MKEKGNATKLVRVWIGRRAYR